MNIECNRMLLAIPQNTGYIGRLHLYELLNSAAITMMIYEQETSSMLTIINFTERWNAHKDDHASNDHQLRGHVSSRLSLYNIVRATSHDRIRQSRGRKN